MLFRCATTQLKQENDDLKQELAAAREQKLPYAQQSAAVTEQAPSCADEVGAERNILRQEIHALQVQMIISLIERFQH